MPWIPQKVYKRKQIFLGHSATTEAKLSPRLWHKIAPAKLSSVNFLLFCCLSSFKLAYYFNCLLRQKSYHLIWDLENLDLWNVHLIHMLSRFLKISSLCLILVVQWQLISSDNSYHVATDITLESNESAQFAYSNLLISKKYKTSIIAVVLPAQKS